MKAILLFDIDGTLALFCGQGRIAFENAFYEMFGIQSCWGETNPHGRTDPLIFKEIALQHLRRELSNEEYNRLILLYQSHFERQLMLMPDFINIAGAADFVEFVSRSGDWILGIGTGNLEYTAWAKLRHAGIDSFFAGGGFASDAEHRSEILRIGVQKLEKSSNTTSLPCIVIGDTPLDVHAGKAIGARILAVAANGYDCRTLLDAGADHVVENFLDKAAVMAILEQLAG